MSLQKSIIKTKVELQNRSLKKSGKNNFAGFTYFELSDFLPTLNELMLEESINDVFSITEDYAKLTLIKEGESQEYLLPFTHFTTPLNKNGSQSMQDIQYLGAIITYYKRYLYMSAFGITDGEVIDSMEATDKPQVTTTPKATQDDVLTIQGLITQTDADMKKFLSAYKVSKIDDLDKVQVESAITLLTKKLKDLL